MPPKKTQTAAQKDTKVKSAKQETRGKAAKAKAEQQQAAEKQEREDAKKAKQDKARAEREAKKQELIQKKAAQQAAKEEMAKQKLAEKKAAEKKQENVEKQGTTKRTRRKKPATEGGDEDAPRETTEKDRAESDAVEQEAGDHHSENGLGTPELAEPPHPPGVSITGHILLNGNWAVRRYSNDFENGKERLLLDRSNDDLVHPEHRTPKVKTRPIVNGRISKPGSRVSRPRRSNAQDFDAAEPRATHRATGAFVQDASFVGSGAHNRRDSGSYSPRPGSRMYPNNDMFAITTNAESIREVQDTHATSIVDETSRKRKSPQAIGTDVSSKPQMSGGIPHVSPESDDDDEGHQTPPKRPRLSSHAEGPHSRPTTPPSDDNDFTENESDAGSSHRRRSSRYDEDTDTIIDATGMSAILRAADEPRPAGDSVEAGVGVACLREDYLARQVRGGEVRVGTLRRAWRESMRVPDLDVDESALLR